MYVTEANGIAYARVEHNIAVEKTDNKTIINSCR